MREARALSPAWPGLRSLGVAHLAALLAGFAGAAVYASRLDADLLAGWGVALMTARAGQLLLDGGLRLALVRRASWPSAAALRTLRRGNAAAAVAAWLLLMLGLSLAQQTTGLPTDIGLLIGGYAGAYWLSYPLHWLALARLERQASFVGVGRAEAASTLLEFVLPAALMLAGCGAVPAFVAAAVTGRLAKTLLLVTAGKALRDSVEVAPDRPRRLVGEGLALQGVAAVSMLRDHLHLLLLAPLAGSAAAGQFAFAMLAGQLASQLLVQTTARWLLPQLHELGKPERAALLVSTLRGLAIAVLPLLAFSLPALHWLDTLLWDGRWQLAVTLLPWIALRLLAGCAMTLLGSWMMVERAPGQVLACHLRWTAIEVAVALPAIWLAGAPGLAVAGAFTGWLGLLLFVAACTPQAAPAARRALRQKLLGALLARPSLLTALLIALGAWVQPLLLLLLPLAWLAEPAVRERLRPQPTSRPAHG